MSLLNNPIALIATANLIIQAIVLVLLVYGYQLNRRHAVQRHGRVMAVAVFLHLAVVIAIMVPSFVLAVIPEYVFARLSGVVSIISLIHVPLGVSALTLGIWLVFSWRFKGLKSCFKRKRFMRWTMTVWLASLFLGIVLYAILYGAALMS